MQRELQGLRLAEGVEAGDNAAAEFDSVELALIKELQHAKRTVRSLAACGSC